MNKLTANLITNYNSYIENIRIVNICCFTALIFLVIILYLIYWRNFEESLNDLVINIVNYC